MRQLSGVPPYSELHQIMGPDELIKLMPHPLFVKDSHSRVVMMNPACEALWGVRLEQIVGTDGTDALPEANVRAIREQDRKAFASGKTCVDETYIWNAVHQGMRWMLTYKHPTYDSEGRPHLLIASCIDITERKVKEAAAESALRQTRQVAGRQQDAMETQHRHLARSTQDNLAQNLMALKLDITMLQARTVGQQPLLHERATQALETLNHSIQNVRDIINELHPATLELGLTAAIEWQLQQMEKLHGLQYRLLVQDDSAVLTQQQTSALFRLVQDGLGYLRTDASTVLVELNLHREHIAITISSDAGAGTEASNALNAIHERLATLGGTLRATPNALHIALPAAA